MKKYYKNFKTKHMTVETMLTCAQKCTVYKNCSCETACAGSVVNGAAITVAPNVNGTATVDPILVATGSAVG